MGVLIDHLPSDPLEALRELTRCEAEMSELRRHYVAEARAVGVSWDQIGESLGMTRQSAWEYFSHATRESMTARAASSLDEDDAMRLAVEETREVRRQRAR
jgi:hypothetical protein